MARQLVRPVLPTWLAQLSGEVSEICRYHFGLASSEMSTDERHGGKLVRSAFALLCTSAVGGSAADAVPPALAIEFIHNASLIHDDVMDGDRLRRYRPSIWSRFGIPWAVLAGDALIALSFEALSVDDSPRAAIAVMELSRVLRKLALGQGDDMSFERGGLVSLPECVAMLEGKTGALFGYACQVGAQYAGAPAQWAAQFERFGTNLGVAFQLVDDVKGIWADPGTTGKPIGSDLQARKRSGPVVAALNSGSPAATRLAQLYGCGRDLVPEELELAADLIAETGGRDWAEQEARRRVETAWGLINGLDLVDAPRKDLEELTWALTEGRTG